MAAMSCSPLHGLSEEQRPKIEMRVKVFVLSLIFVALVVTVVSKIVPTILRDLAQPYLFMLVLTLAILAFSLLNQDLPSHG
ncbi:hypothetical protein FAGAP_2838 [Fusarium agapanthi]|uniref:Uncharacterized protein n=1 Tax=Fusarium agapanthi TaxID=1803897 RepID=A0A9P5BF64_9HYPO|nr:hypothetical protein FAGAP_2838 [Fusarium agapanthi]